MFRRIALASLSFSLLSIISASLLFPVQMRAQQTTYLFAGTPFPEGSQIWGSFTVAQPLPPNLAYTPGPLGEPGSGPGTFTPLSFFFTDGTLTLTNLNSSESGFTVGTDANGNITLWRFYVHTGVGPHCRQFCFIDSRFDAEETENYILYDFVETEVTVGPIGKWTRTPCLTYGTCGVLITVVQQPGLTPCSSTGCASVTVTDQSSYDWNDDVLVGVLNDTEQPLDSLDLSGDDLFSFTGLGIDAFGLPGNALDSTEYGGTDVYFINISPDLKNGRVKTVSPAAPKGGTVGFSLHKKRISTCPDILKNSVSVTLGGGSPPNNITLTFKPNKGYTLSEAASLCGFKAFGWVQVVKTLPDPSPFCAKNPLGLNYPNPAPFCGSNVTSPYPLHLTGSFTPFNDPPQFDYTYVPLSWNNGKSPYPFFYDPETSGYPLSLDKNTDLHANTVTFYDSPADPCLADADGNPSPIWLTGAKDRCGGQITPAKASIQFWTELAGVNQDDTAKYLGIGRDWQSTWNGWTGKTEVLTTIPGLTADPGTGTGGIIVTHSSDATSYEYPKMLKVIGLNGATVVPPISSGLLVTGSQIATTASGLAYSRKSRTFNGTIKITNTSSTSISGPFQVVLHSLTDGVTLLNATSTIGGWSYVTIPGPGTLAPGQSATGSIIFSNPSNAKISFIPIIYAGSFD